MSNQISHPKQEETPEEFRIKALQSLITEQAEIVERQKTTIASLNFTLIQTNTQLSHKANEDPMPVVLWIETPAANVENIERLETFSVPQLVHVFDPSTESDTAEANFEPGSEFFVTDRRSLLELLFDWNREDSGRIFFIVRDHRTQRGLV